MLVLMSQRCLRVAVGLVVVQLMVVRLVLQAVVLQPGVTLVLCTWGGNALCLFRLFTHCARLTPTRPFVGPSQSRPSDWNI